MAKQTKPKLPAAERALITAIDAAKKRIAKIDSELDNDPKLELYKLKSQKIDIEFDRELSAKERLTKIVDLDTAIAVLEKKRKRYSMDRLLDELFALQDDVVNLEDELMRFRFRYSDPDEGED
jgi:Sec-independent protein translocase protein TatA